MARARRPVCRQFNVLGVHASLRAPTRGRLKAVVHMSVLGSAVLYVVFGVAGLLYANLAPTVLVESDDDGGDDGDSAAAATGRSVMP